MPCSNGSKDLERLQAGQAFTMIGHRLLWSCQSWELVMLVRRGAGGATSIHKILTSYGTVGSNESFQVPTKPSLAIVTTVLRRNMWQQNQRPLYTLELHSILLPSCLLMNMCEKPPRQNVSNSFHQTYFGQAVLLWVSFMKAACTWRNNEDSFGPRTSRFSKIPSTLAPKF